MSRVPVQTPVEPTFKVVLVDSHWRWYSFIAVTRHHPSANVGCCSGYRWGQWDAAGWSCAKSAASQASVIDVDVVALARRLTRPRSTYRRQPLLQHSLRGDPSWGWRRRQDHVRHCQGPERRLARPPAGHALWVQGADRQGWADQSLLQRRRGMDARWKLVYKCQHFGTI